MTSTINLESATNSLELFSCLTLGIFGLITNILNIIVSSGKKVLKTNMGFYNVKMSTFNILIILSRFLSITPSLSLESLLLTSQFACVTIPYVQRVVSQISVWIYIFISFDRTLLMSKIKKPLKMDLRILNKEASSPS